MGVLLTDREQMVLRHRFGFEDGHMHDPTETALRYGVTPERIQQVEARALRKLGWETFLGQEALLGAIARALEENE